MRESRIIACGRGWPRCEASRTGEAGHGLSLERDPSSGTDFVRATFSHKGRREEDEMTSPDLPAELKAALDARLQGLSRSDAAGRAALISRTYRDGGGSGGITSEADALAYAVVRMPATYAAVTASLNALGEIRPEFAPARLFRGWLG
jgi:ribosomal protein RSM22 (predicted rRNA methylase)